MSITEQNYIAYAIRGYLNPSCGSKEEFLEDINRIIYIKKLLRKFKRNKEIKTRLLLNHVRIFYNVFPIDAATKLLFLKIEPELWSVLKTILEFFGFLPEVVKDVNGQDINTTTIHNDEAMQKYLKEL